MPCSIPTSFSPGYLGLTYIHTTQLLSHHMRLRLDLLGDPYDFGAMSALATLWAAALADTLSPNFRIDGWTSYDETGTVILVDFFTTPVVGLKAPPGGSFDGKSKTITITGRGDSSGSGECTGEARNVIFVGNTYNFVAGEKQLAISSDVDLDNYAQFLGDATHAMFADFYGHKAVPRGLASVQFNAAIQRRDGT